MLVTTASKPDAPTTKRAERLAEELEGRFVPRRTFTLAQLKKKYSDDALLVVGGRKLKYIYPDGTPLFFHPNLARIRITSMITGTKDRLIETANVEKGDVIIDCTTGLGTDAIVLSFAAGKSGKVITLESSHVLHVLAREGFKDYISNIEAINSSMRRVKAIHTDHLDYLKSLPDKSVDIVYFDPMFREPDKSVAFEPIRDLANHSAVTCEAIEEAKRAARKRVVIREHRNSGEFERLGFTIPKRKKRKKVEYGVISLI